MDDLRGLKVAILVDDGFEQVELVEPRAALDLRLTDEDLAEIDCAYPKPVEARPLEML